MCIIGVSPKINVHAAKRAIDEAETDVIFDHSDTGRRAYSTAKDVDYWGPECFVFFCLGKMKTVKSFTHSDKSSVPSSRSNLFCSGRKHIYICSPHLYGLEDVAGWELLCHLRDLPEHTLPKQQYLVDGICTYTDIAAKFNITTAAERI